MKIIKHKILKKYADAIKSGDKIIELRKWNDEKHNCLENSNIEKSLELKVIETGKILKFDINEYSMTPINLVKRQDLEHIFQTKDYQPLLEEIGIKRGDRVVLFYLTGKKFENLKKENE